MKKRSIRLIRTDIKQILFVFAAFAFMVCISYFYVSGIMQEQAKANGEEIMNTMVSEVSGALSETKLAFASVVMTVESMISSQKNIEEIYRTLTYITDYLSSDESPLTDFMKLFVYIGDEYLDGSGWIPPADVTIASRPWYAGAVSQPCTVFLTEPYIDFDSGDLVITFSKSIQDSQGEYCGVAGMDVNLNRIINYVKNIKLADNGYGILISDNMNITAHRDPSLTGKHISEAGTNFDTLIKLLASGSDISAVRLTDYDGVDSIAFFRTILNGWHIGVITPRYNYYKQVVVLAGMLALFGFIIMSSLSFILIRTNTARERSEEESRSKSSFLARMSHEMRTPMNAIMGMSVIAKRSDNLTDIKYYLDKIDNASTHLLGVINDVLDVSKIEAGKFDLSETEFLIESMMQQVISVINFKLEENQQALKVYIDEKVPAAIITDRQRLAQVITNLLSNAAKFSPKDSTIELYIYGEEAEENRCRLCFEVRDYGIGMTAEQISRLFQPFEQGDVTISRKYGGTGLGLSISKKIVEAMNGDIHAESVLGEGSCFLFHIQAGIGSEERLASVSSASSLDSNLDLSGRRILLAEDVEINREILSALLSDTGVQIDYAENGKEAYEKFAENGRVYDLIFMDIHMPELDGYEASRKIRSLDSDHAHTIPIVAMSASVFKEDIDKCLQSGMNGHIGKPLVLDEVLEVLRKYLGHRPL